MNIGVVVGGYSDESVISIRSGQLILKNLDPDKYTVYEVRILPEGWYVLANDSKYDIDKSDFSFVKDDKKIQFDIAINTIHGTPGEDGHLQAYWELIGLNYTGCGFYQSALTFNKRDTLSVLNKFDIPKAKSIYLSKGDAITATEVIATLGLPFMVKPNQSGSSLGISKVNNPEEFDAALQKAFKEDSDVLIEAYIKGVEVSVGVLNFKGETTVLGITEIISHNDFFDYEAKYEGKSDEITPARIDKTTEDRVRQTAIKAYEALGMSGFTRSEFIIMEGVPYFIEMNTNPGLSPQSIFPQQAQHAGIPFAELLESEIQLAQKRKVLWKK
ncbi:D-alanine--D-alanine ligase [Flavobacterium rhizosphaerae]|uniref:D-alanine--D-alanine ligase n=1 Tax=Flavobacterium rhizosphaerae TaxID=3163298 RepID=A0ABW8YSL6_9FLAO